MDRPQISVLLPVYNAAPYLREAVESLLGQTYAAFELIAINDGSTDKSGEILERYAGQHSKLRIHHQNNSGIVKTLNYALGLARGRYVVRQDADDVSLPHRFQLQAEFLDANPNIAVVGGAIQIIGPDGGLGGIETYPITDDAIRARLKIGCPFAHPAVMMRADALRSLGGYREVFEHAEDYDLWLRFSEHWKLANLREVVLNYRQHAAQVSQVRVLQQTLATLAARGCAALRRQGMPDPVCENTRIDDDFLTQIGCSPDEVALELVRAFVSRGYRQLSAGDRAAAIELGSQALSEMRCRCRNGRAVREAHWMVGRLVLKAGLRRSGWGLMLRSILSNPLAFVARAMNRV